MSWVGMASHGEDGCALGRSGESLRGEMCLG